MAKDIGSILNDIADNNVADKAIGGIPSVKIKTTNTKDEMKKHARKHVFSTKFFAINNDIDAEQYASFMNWLLEVGAERRVVREESNWTKEGELVRVVDFVQRTTDKTSYKDPAPVYVEEGEEKEDITTQKKEEFPDKGERFDPDDYVQG